MGAVLAAGRRPVVRRAVLAAENGPVLLPGPNPAAIIGEPGEIHYRF
jgi:hypothetical protein